MSDELFALAERCRPAVAHDARLRERDQHSDKYAPSYRPVLKAAAERAAKLLDDIDAILAGNEGRAVKPHRSGGPVAPHAEPSFAQSETAAPKGIGLVKKMRDERDEIWNAALDVLTHCDAKPEGETDFERAVIALRAACAKVPSYTERLNRIFAFIAEPEEQPNDKRGDTVDAYAIRRALQEFPTEHQTAGLLVTLSAAVRTYLACIPQSAIGRSIPIDDNMIANAKLAQKVGMSRVTMSAPVDWILGDTDSGSKEKP